MENNKDRIQGIFPKTSLGSPKPDDISEDEWIDNMISTWCLNSSQAGVDGVLRCAIQKAMRENKDEIMRYSQAVKASDFDSDMRRFESYCLSHSGLSCRSVGTIDGYYCDA